MGRADRLRWQKLIWGSELVSASAGVAAEQPGAGEPNQNAREQALAPHRALVAVAGALVLEVCVRGRGRGGTGEVVLGGGQ